MLYYVCQIYNAVGKFNGVGTEIERVRKSMLVDEAMEILYDEIEKTLNWKFIKSRKTFKKVVEDLVFEITFFHQNGINLTKTLKYNVSSDYGVKNLEII